MNEKSHSSKRDQKSENMKDWELRTTEWGNRVRDNNQDNDRILKNWEWA